MGRVVGLSWIFCVKRVYVFCRRDLHHFAKALRTLQKIRSNPDQAPLGRVLIQLKTKTKEHMTNAICSLVGRVVGFEPTRNGTTIRGLNHLTKPAITQVQ